MGDRSPAVAGPLHISLDSAGGCTDDVRLTGSRQDIRRDISDREPVALYRKTEPTPFR